jgi:ubiquitin-activating enzyme E1
VKKTGRKIDANMMSIFHLLPFVGTFHLFILLQSVVNGARQPWASSSISTRRAFDSLATSIQEDSSTRTSSTDELRTIISGFKAPFILFGCGKESIQRRKRHSLVSINDLRGGSSDNENANDIDAAVEVVTITSDDDETDIQTQATTQEDAATSNNNNNNSNNNNKSKKKKLDNDDERYSRQMFALGARAHKLVRSTTAILDGPMGGKIASNKLDDDDVIIDGADGFDGLQGNGRNEEDHNSKRDTSLAKVSEVPSGLLYEVAKNLALSGVGRIILVDDDDDDATPTDVGYFDGTLDDLGAAYRRAALSEIFGSSTTQDDNESTKNIDIDDEEDDESDLDESVDSGATLLAEYIQRLNPGVQVDIIKRGKLLDLMKESDGTDKRGSEEDAVSLGTNPVVVCIDRSQSMQLEMNDACRYKCAASGKSEASVPFVSVETAGVHSRVFCDFGPKFVVVDEDGETPRSTLLDRVEEGDTSNNSNVLTVHCLEGERHDVSCGDVIQFQGDQSDGQDGNIKFPKYQVTTVKSPSCFTVKRSDEEEESAESLMILLGGGARSFARVKIPKATSFLSLREILHPSYSDKTETTRVFLEDESLFAPSDLDKSFDPVRRRAVMTCMAALDLFVKKYNRLPSRIGKKDNQNASKQKRTDIDRFHSLIRKLIKETDSASPESETWDSVINQFAQTCRGKFTPIQALSGALAAQEVLKAATGLYNPVHQFLLYDCDEVLHGNEEYSESESVASGQSYILGEHISNKLARSRIFLVGAGAIGCELLKNLSAMGAATGSSNTKQGCLIITDMDTIEKSNLSRQLLFRDHDVGEFKSTAARAAMMRFLPDCHIEAHTSRVGDEEDGPFDDDFWASGCNVVLNALDNVEARLFVDRKCVSHGLGLVDAGTLGPKGNVQVVVPNYSESYGSSADPPEPDIPVCTLKNFPYEISHTIQWARDLFDGYFNRRPRQANDHVVEISQAEDLTNIAQALLEKLGEDAATDMAEELGEDLGVFPFVVGSDDPSDPEYVLAVKKASLKWAIERAHNLFFTSMDELIQKHPIDSLDDDGQPFWSGTRRPPKPFRFIPLDSEDDEVSAQQVIINERIAEFVAAATRLRMESFLSVSGEDAPSLISLDEALSALQVHAKELAKQRKSKEILHNLSGGGGSDTVSVILDKLNGAKTGASFLPRLNLADFEKDDESNGHVAFVTAASNLRALSYGIAPADPMETRRVAGRIVPAMITTTGLVSALSCLELVKLLKGVPLNIHRNAFVNLALPFFAFTAPLPAEEVLGVNGKTHTIWDSIVIKGSSKTPAELLTLNNFIEKVKKKAGCEDGVEISSISYGPYMIYANFLHSDDEELLETAILSIVKDAVVAEDGDDDDGDDFAFDEETDGDEPKKTVELTAEQKAAVSKLDHRRFIDFSVAVENEETGEEFELPVVRLERQKKDIPIDETEQ